MFHKILFIHFFWICNLSHFVMIFLVECLCIFIYSVKYHCYCIYCFSLDKIGSQGAPQVVSVLKHGKIIYLDKASLWPLEEELGKGFSQL